DVVQARAFWKVAFGRAGVAHQVYVEAIRIGDGDEKQVMHGFGARPRAHDEAGDDLPFTVAVEVGRRHVNRFHVLHGGGGDALLAKDASGQIIHRRAFGRRWETPRRAAATQG